MQKTRTTYASFFNITLKTSLWAHFDSFWPKHFKTRFFSKKPFRSILRFCVDLTLWKNSEKFHMSMKFEIWKTYFQRIPKTSFKSVLNLYASLRHAKESEMFHALVFDNAWKTYFWAQFGPQKSENKNFPRRVLLGQV